MEWNTFRHIPSLTLTFVTLQFGRNGDGIPFILCFNYYKYHYVPMFLPYSASRIGICTGVVILKWFFCFGKLL